MLVSLRRVRLAKVVLLAADVLQFILEVGTLETFDVRLEALYRLLLVPCHTRMGCLFVLL